CAPVERRHQCVDGGVVGHGVAPTLFSVPGGCASRDGTGEQMFDQRYQYRGRGPALPDVAQHDGGVRLEVEGRAHLVGFVAERVVELVDGHEKVDAAGLEVVDGREAVAEAAGVDQHDGPQRTVGQLVP